MIRAHGSLLAAIIAVTLAVTLIAPLHGDALADTAAGMRSAHVDATAELAFVNRINRERVARGLGALRQDDRLRALARYHSAAMALGGFVALIDPGDGSLVARAAKLVGAAATVVTAQVAAGPDLSRAGEPLLAPELGVVGVGVVSLDGSLFLTELAIAGAPEQGYTARDAWVTAQRPLALARMLLESARALVARFHTGGRAARLQAQLPR